MGADTMRWICAIAFAMLLPGVALGQEPAPASEPLDAATMQALGIEPEPALRVARPVAPNVGTANWTTGIYSYDPSGNITAIGSSQYLYDAHGRLVDARVARPDQPGAQVRRTYTYDAFGNMIAEGSDTATTGMTTSSATNHLTYMYAMYDDAGNLIQIQPPGQSIVNQYRYDALNAIQEAKAANVTGETRQLYIYTAADERIWTYDLQTNVSHWKLRDLAGKVQRDYVVTGTAWQVSRDYVYRDGQLLAAATPTSAQYYSLDHLGTPRVITNAARVRVGFHHYLPFRQEWTDASGDQEGEVLKFTGHERDRAPAAGSDGLDYMHARYYEAGLGRFLSIDPVLNVKRALRQPQNWNRYSYVMNSPLNYTDPTGEDVSIRLEFSGDGWTAEDKKRIIAQVAAWYQKQGVGKVFVFDGATHSHGRFLGNLLRGHTSLNVTSGTGTGAHKPGMVFAGNYFGDKSLNRAQQIRAISNTIIHETAAHKFSSTYVSGQDQLFYLRNIALAQQDPGLRARYGTVADSYAFDAADTRGNVTNGPIPIHPDDLRSLQQYLGSLRAEPPEDD